MSKVPHNDKSSKSRPVIRHIEGSEHFFGAFERARNLKVATPVRFSGDTKDTKQLPRTQTNFSVCATQSLTDEASLAEILEEAKLFRATRVQAILREYDVDSIPEKELALLVHRDAENLIEEVHDIDPFGTSRFAHEMMRHLRVLAAHEGLAKQDLGLSIDFKAFVPPSRGEFLQRLKDFENSPAWRDLKSLRDAPGGGEEKPEAGEIPKPDEGHGNEVLKKILQALGGGLIEWFRNPFEKARALWRDVRIFDKLWDELKKEGLDPKRRKKIWKLLRKILKRLLRELWKVLKNLGIVFSWISLIWTLWDLYDQFLA